VCSTASSWVEFNDSRSTGREYNSRHRPILQQILPPQPVQEYLHISTSLLHCRLRYHDFEALFLHRPKEDWRFVTTGICEDRLSAGRKQLRYEVGEGGCVLTFVEDVRGEDQVESSPTRYARLAPVESGDLRFLVQVSVGVVSCELEGGLVVVRSKDFGALGERKYGGQPDAAPQLDNARTPKVSFR
jgi:hypothetical protein